MSYESEAAFKYHRHLRPALPGQANMQSPSAESFNVLPDGVLPGAPLRGQAEVAVSKSAGGTPELTRQTPPQAAREAAQSGTSESSGLAPSPVGGLSSSTPEEAAAQPAATFPSPAGDSRVL